MSTLRAAIELKSVFDQIQAAEKAGNMSPEEKKKLEEQAAEKGLQALFKVRRVLLCLLGWVWFWFLFVFFFFQSDLKIFAPSPFRPA